MGLQQGQKTGPRNDSNTGAGRGPEVRGAVGVRLALR